MTPPITLGILASAGKGKVYYIATAYAYGLNEAASMHGAALDSTGNAYFYGGARDSSSALKESLLVKITAGASVAFKKNLNKSTSYLGYGTGGRLRLDSSGNIVVLAKTQDSGRHNIARLPADGSSFTYQRDVRGGSFYSSAATLAIDNSGRYINAMFNMTGDWAAGVQVIDPTNSSVWYSAGIDYNTSDSVAINGVSVDNSNNYYMSTTRTGGSNPTLVGAAMTKMSYNGSTNNMSTVFHKASSINSGDGRGGASTIDRTNNFLYTAYAMPIMPNYVPIIYSCNTSLAHRWTKLGPINCNFDDLVVDSSGYLYAVGYSSSTKGLIMKLDSNGAIIWQREISVTVSGAVAGFSINSIAVDNLGNLAVAGISGAGNNTGNYTMIKLPADGSVTGTYTVGSQVFTIAASSVTLTAETATVPAPSYGYRSTSPTNLAYSTTLVNSGAAITTKTL